MNIGRTTGQDVLDKSSQEGQGGFIMKKGLILILALVVLMSVLVGCNLLTDLSRTRTLYYPDGNGTILYEGELKDGVPHGQGTEYRRDGTIAYEGEWKDGEHHGQGTAYLEDGTIWYEGEWKDNNPVGR